VLLIIVLISGNSKSDIPKKPNCNKYCIKLLCGKKNKDEFLTKFIVPEPIPNKKLLKINGIAFSIKSILPESLNKGLPDIEITNSKFKIKVIKKDKIKNPIVRLIIFLFLFSKKYKKNIIETN
jgi:hypothetical protein